MALPSSQASTLDISQNSAIALNHQTQAKVITGAVVITFSGTSYQPLMLQSMAEPAEEVIGSAAPVNVLHLLTPLEWVAPAYGGGKTTLTFIEAWTSTPYEQAGFKEAQEFLDIINTTEFTVNAITYLPSLYGGGNNQVVLNGCRVLGPIVPTPGIARSTMTRTQNATIGYTRLQRKGYKGRGSS